MPRPSNSTSAAPRRMDGWTDHFRGSVSLSDGDTDQSGLGYVGGQTADQAPVVSGRVPGGRHRSRVRGGATASTFTENKLRLCDGAGSSGSPLNPGLEAELRDLLITSASSQTAAYGMTLMSSFPWRM